MEQNHRINQRFETVAVRGVTRLQAQRFNGDHVCAMQRNQAMRRPDKLHIAPAIGQLVGHDFGNRQFGNRLQQGFLQAFSECCAGHQAVIEQGFGFAIQRTLQTRNAGRIRPQCS